MDILYKHWLISTLYFLLLIICQFNGITTNELRFKKQIHTTRPGRCPHPRYAIGTKSCSVVGNDVQCPRQLKCCPGTTGLKCFNPCPNWAIPCGIKCLYGLKVSASGCTICQCASNPCLTKVCSRSKICRVVDYTPCTKPGACGKIGQCVLNQQTTTSSTSKIGRCTDYWPKNANQAISGYFRCNSSDYECPGNEKCCEGPREFPTGIEPNPPTLYCAPACKNPSNCALTCQFNFVVDGGCQLCKCAPNPCVPNPCESGKRCQPMIRPCYHYSGSPPCEYYGQCY